MGGSPGRLRVLSDHPEHIAIYHLACLPGGLHELYPSEIRAGPHRCRRSGSGRFLHRPPREAAPRQTPGAQKKDPLLQRRPALLPLRVRAPHDPGGRLAAHRRGGRNGRGHLCLRGGERGRSFLSLPGGPAFRRRHASLRTHGLLAHLAEHAEPDRPGTGPAHGADRSRPSERHGFLRQRAHGLLWGAGREVQGSRGRPGLGPRVRSRPSVRGAEGAGHRIRHRGSGAGLRGGSGGDAALPEAGGGAGNDAGIDRVGGQDLPDGPRSIRRPGSGRRPDLSHRGDVSQTGSGRADLDPGRAGRLPGAHALQRLHPGRGHAHRLGGGSRAFQGCCRLWGAGALPQRRSHRNRPGGAQDPLPQAREFSWSRRQLLEARRGRALRLVFQMAVGGRGTTGPDRVGGPGADRGSRQALCASPPVQAGR